MGLFDFFTGKSAEQDQGVTEIGGVPVKTIEVGSSGTEIFSGYISEEYLSELRGRDWADKVDKMRRSDAQVKAALSALKLPLKSSNWYLQTTESTPEAEMQKRLIEKALFEDIGKSFTKLIGEILTCLDFGYSVFELTHRVNVDDPELGTYNTLAGIAWRSQRTLDRWRVNRDTGQLEGVSQWADGDLARYVELDARFLVHFAPEMEGDNFEGISLLRPMYGNWLRKNAFLKFLAAGMEKYSIPTPMLEVPEGKENSPEFTRAQAVLKKYTSNQANYITFPTGWKLTFNNIIFDAEKLRLAIEFENREMLMSILATFLSLGQAGSGGSRALGDSLTDFFSQTVQYIADHISEQMERKVMLPLVKMNFGDVPLLVELRADGLNEKADKSWAETMKILKDGGLVDADQVLKEFIREKYKLPESEISATPDLVPSAALPDAPPPAPENAPGTGGGAIPKPATLAEPKRASKQREVADIIRGTEKALSALYKPNLQYLGSGLINGLMKNTSLKAASDVSIGSTAAYFESVRHCLTKAAYEAKQTVEAIVPKKKTLQEFRLGQTKAQRLSALDRQVDKLADQLVAASNAYVVNPSSPVAREALGEAIVAYADKAKAARELYEDLGDLGAKTLSSVRARADFIVQTQAADLQKAIGIQWQSSSQSTDSESLLRKDLNDRLATFVSGPVVNTGASIMASQVVNDARLESLNELDAEDEVESYTFIAVDDERTTEICRELDGRTFAPDDPNIERYSPPLHYNCRSYLAINMRSFKGNPTVDEEPLALSKGAIAAINLAEVAPGRLRH